MYVAFTCISHEIYYNYIVLNIITIMFLTQVQKLLPIIITHLTYNYFHIKGNLVI